MISLGVRAFIVAKKSRNWDGAKGGRKIERESQARMKGILTTVASVKPKQVRDTQDRWSWVSRSVWTDSMLTTLEKGVKGEKWYSLIDKVYNQSNLKSSWEKVQKNKGSSGVDKQTIQQFANHADDRLERIAEELRGNTYSPNFIRREYIPKADSKEKRPLGIPTVKDRVVQTALRNVIEPIFERKLVKNSYGFRPQKSTKDALEGSGSDAERRLQICCGCRHREIL